MTWELFAALFFRDDVARWILAVVKPGRKGREKRSLSDLWAVMQSNEIVNSRLLFNISLVSRSLDMYEKRERESIESFFQ